MEKLFGLVTKRLTEFIGLVRGKEGTMLATDRWTVDDVLRHVTFWHSNYADNYSALAAGDTPPLLEGPYHQLNHSGVDGLKDYSREALMTKLQKAHKVLEHCILVDKVPRMQYKKDGRIMTTSEFLQTVDAHLRGHINQVKKAH